MRKRLFSLLATAGLVVSACGGAASPTPSAAPGSPSTAPASQAPSPSSAAGPDLTTTKYSPSAIGNTSDKPLIVAEWQSPDTFNPYYAQANTDIEAATPALRGLVNVSNDLKYLPDLVTEVPFVSNGDVVVSGTGMTVTYKLKSGMQWSDGQPITCKDIEGTWKWIMDKDQTGLAGGTTGWEDITSVDTSSDTNCVVTFGKIYEGYLSLWSPLLPAHYLATVPAVKDAPTKLYPLTNLASGVYSGPYMPTTYKADAQLNYVANPKFLTIYPNKKLAFPSLIFKYYGDSDAMKAGFSAGEYDLAMDLNHSDIPSIQSQNPLINDSTTYEQISINNKSLTEKFGAADLDTIKQAIALAIDKSQITDRVLGGTVKPISNPMSPLYWFHTDVPDQKFDPTQANSLLDAASWVKGTDGIRTKNGKKLEVNFCTTKRPYRVDSLAVYASNLKAIGISSKSSPVKSSLIFDGWNDPATDPCSLIHGNYDLAMFAWVAPLDPLGSYNVYTCQGIPDNPPHNGQNNTRTCDPAVDAIWNTVKTNVDFTKVKDAMGQWQTYYNQHVIEIPLFYWKDVYLVNPKLQNVTGNPSTATVLWNVEDWWVQP